MKNLLLLTEFHGNLNNQLPDVQVKVQVQIQRFRDKGHILRNNSKCSNTLNFTALVFCNNKLDSVKKEICLSVIND